MGKQQSLLAGGGVIVAVIIGIGTMTAWSLDPAVSAPIMIILALVAVTCFLMAWNISREDGEEGAAPVAHAIPDLRAVDSPALREIASGEEWKKLNALLHSGAVASWSRTKGIKNLRPIRPQQWFNDSLEFVEVDGNLESFAADATDLRPAPWRKMAHGPRIDRSYDIHFNRAQLREHWPDKF